MNDHTKNCFGGDIEEQVWLDSIAQAIENKKCSIQKYTSWSQLYEYYFGAHYALQKSLDFDICNRKLGSYYNNNVRPALPTLALAHWKPNGSNVEFFNTWVSGFYLNNAIDRIAALTDRIKENSEQLKECGVKVNLRIPDSKWIHTSVPKDTKKLYELVHNYVATCHVVLMRQDWNYRKHRTSRNIRRRNEIPSEWPADHKIALQLRRGVGDYSVGEDTLKKSTPFGCLRPRCLWRATVLSLQELINMVTV